MTNLCYPKEYLKTDVITGPETRWNYVHIFEPYAFRGEKPRYSVCLIIPKSDTQTVDMIQAAILTAYKEGAMLLRGYGMTVPSLESINTPLHDGDLDKKKGPETADAYFITATTKTCPGVVDLSGQPVTDPALVYSGVYGRASLSFEAYNTTDRKTDQPWKGIRCELNNLQLVHAGEPLGIGASHRRSAAEDFAAYSGGNAYQT